MDSEERIRMLCFELLRADTEHLIEIAAELREAIHSHLEHARLKVLEYADQLPTQEIEEDAA